MAGIKSQKSTTKAELVKHVAKELNLSLRVSTKEVETILGAVRDALLDGNNVDLSPFGKFELKKHGARMSHNPHTGEPVAVKGKLVPSFIPGKQLMNL